MTLVDKGSVQIPQEPKFEIRCQCKDLIGEQYVNISSLGLSLALVRPPWNPTCIKKNENYIYINGKYMM